MCQTIPAIVNNPGWRTAETVNSGHEFRKGNRLPFSDDPNPLQESRLAAFSNRQSREVFTNFQPVLWPRRLDHRHRGGPGTDVRYRRKMSGSAGLRSAACQMPDQGCPSRPGPVRRQCQNRSLPSTFPCSPRSIETACCHNAADSLAFSHNDDFPRIPPVKARRPSRRTELRASAHASPECLGGLEY